MLYPQNGDRIVAVYFVTSFTLCIIWYRSRAVTPCGWEGNRRIGIALAMRHRLIQLFIQLHVHAHGLRKGDKHPAYTPRGVWHCFTFTEVKS